MKYRTLGKTNLKISEVSLGTWQVGGKWGSDFNEKNAETILNRAIDMGVNFIDTADVYSDGDSEKMVGKIVKSRSENIYIATKCGRQISPHVSEGYLPDVLRKYVEDSLKRLQVETIDLMQLHCPPTEVYYRPEIFELFDTLKSEGKIKNLGVSVEKVEEALKAINYPNVTTIQIIFNMFRLRPKEIFFQLAEKNNIGIIVRVPLASGLLSGKITKDTKFEPGDHRFFNRDGKYFDKGETFSGVNFETGLNAVEQIKELFPDNLAARAIKWALMFKQVSCVIPGASRSEQVASNMAACELDNIPEDKMKKIESIYNNLIRYPVHHLW